MLIDSADEVLRAAHLLVKQTETTFAKLFEQGDSLMNCELSEKQIDLEDYKTTYCRGGEASNSAPILFLDGWTISTAPYRESLKFLCQKYRPIYRFLENALIRNALPIPLAMSIA